MNFNINDHIYTINFEKTSIKTILPESYSEEYLFDFLETDFFLVALRSLLPEISPKIFLPDLSFIEDYFITINIINKTIDVSQNLIDNINNNYSNYNLFIIPIQIILPNSLYDYDINPDTLQTDTSITTSHANFIIIDTQKNSIEFFEPHGTIINSPLSIFDYISELHYYIFTYIPFTRLYTFNNSGSSCIFGGVQTIQNRYKSQGSCLGWVLYMIVMRILNNDIYLTTTETITQFIHRYMSFFYSPKQLNSIINKFMSYISLLYLSNSHLYKPSGHIRYNMFIPDNEILDSRLLKLMNLYLYKLYYKSFDQCSSIFLELYSYSNYSKFHTLFSRALKNFSELTIQ